MACIGPYLECVTLPSTNNAAATTAPLLLVILILARNQTPSLKKLPVQNVGYSASPSLPPTKQLQPLPHYFLLYLFSRATQIPGLKELPVQNVGYSASPSLPPACSCNHIPATSPHAQPTRQV
jgi:hypothetical protein